MKRLPVVCLSLSFLALTAAAHADMIFGYTGSVQTFTADTAGEYEIIAYGAEGGLYSNHNGNNGGGAEIGGFFNLLVDQTLSVYVGQRGASGATGGGGGGGGTFVVTSGGAPLVVAGGGAGAGGEGAALISTVGGQTGTSGGANLDAGTSGTNGNGGSGGTYTQDPGVGWDGGGGGGFFTSGTEGVPVQSGFGGSAFPTLTGGFGANSGGYGGGGGGGAIGGGGGGGYSGGGGGGHTGNPGGSGAGGGSYFDISGTLDFATGNANFGDGEVQILFIPAQSDSSDTPEPASLALTGLGLLCGVGFSLHRRA